MQVHALTESISSEVWLSASICTLPATRPHRYAIAHGVYKIDTAQTTGAARTNDDVHAVSQNLKGRPEVLLVLQG